MTQTQTAQNDAVVAVFTDRRALVSGSDRSSCKSHFAPMRKILIPASVSRRADLWQWMPGSRFRRARTDIA